MKRMCASSRKEFTQIEIDFVNVFGSHHNALRRPLPPPHPRPPLSVSPSLMLKCFIGEWFCKRRRSRDTGNWRSASFRNIKTQNMQSSALRVEFVVNTISLSSFLSQSRFLIYNDAATTATTSTPHTVATHLLSILCKCLSTGDIDHRKW